MSLDPEQLGATRTTTVTVKVRSHEQSAPGLRSRGRLIALSGSCAGKIFSVEKEEILGRSREASIHLDESDLSRQHAKLRPTGPGEFVIIDLASRNGTFVNGVRVSNAPVAFGDVIQLGSSTVLLFTHYHQLEEQLVQAQRMESIGRLAGGLAHDFNNLTGAALSNLSVLEAKLDDPALLDCVRDSRLALERASQLTSQLLGFAQRGKYSEKPTSLAGVIAEATSLCRRTFDRAIRIETAVDGNLLVLGDHGQLLQALVNLCLNARDAMPEGGILSIRARADDSPPDGLPHSGGYARISVRDTGIGMDAATLQRAFEPYFTTKQAGSGTGMGLAAAYGIVAHHRGTMEIASEVERGTMVDVWLPIIISGAQARPAASEARAGADSATAGSGTILVVDDEEVVRNAHARVLAMLGYDSLLAADGNTALAIYEAERDRIRLVLLDLIMPGLRGEQVFRRLREMAPDVNVVILSGYTEDEDALRKLREDGVRAVLLKPCDTATLSRTLADVLGTASARRPAGRPLQSRPSPATD